MVRTHEFVVGWAEMWVVRVPHWWLESKVGARIGELFVGIGKSTMCLASVEETRGGRPEGKRRATIVTEHLEIRIIKVRDKGCETGGLHKGR